MVSLVPLSVPKFLIILVSPLSFDGIALIHDKQLLCKFVNNRTALIIYRYLPFLIHIKHLDIALQEIRIRVIPPENDLVHRF